MLETLLRDFQGTPEQQRQAYLKVFHLAFLVLAGPGVLLGGAYWLSRPASYAAGAGLSLAALGLLLGLLALWLARRSGRDSRLPPRQARLTATIQAASAPAAPFLLGCAAFHVPLAWAACWGGAALCYLLARQFVVRAS